MEECEIVTVENRGRSHSGEEVGVVVLCGGPFVQVLGECGSYGVVFEKWAWAIEQKREDFGVLAKGRDIADEPYHICVHDENFSTCFKVRA